jgi:hypothetical protein
MGFSFSMAGQRPDQEKLSCWGWYVGNPANAFTFGAHDFRGGAHVEWGGGGLGPGMRRDLLKLCIERARAVDIRGISLQYVRQLLMLEDGVMGVYVWLQARAPSRTYVRVVPVLNPRHS